MRVLVSNSIITTVDLWYNSNMEKTCPCGKEFEIYPSKKDRAKYCSKKCFYKYRKRPSGLDYEIHKENPTWFREGHKPWNKGLSVKKIEQYSNAYDAVHEWVERHIGKKDKCGFCGSKRNLELSNVSGDYKHEENDWQTLCKKCHCKYDYENFGARKEFYE